MWEVLDGCENPSAVNLIPDRTAAIELALRSAEAGDQILLAGWGSDRWTTARNKQTFCDKELAESILRRPNSATPEAKSLRMA